MHDLLIALDLHLTHEWSPHRAGFFAFVSPAIAVVSGAVLLGEHLSTIEILGAVLMIGGTILFMRRPSGARA